MYNWFLEILTVKLHNFIALLQGTVASGQSDAARSALELQLASAVTETAAATAAKDQLESQLEVAAHSQASLESKIGQLESGRAELESQCAAARHALGEATAKLALAVGASQRGDATRGGEAEVTAGAAAVVAASEREVMELRSGIASVETQLRSLQDVLASERKAHATSLGDQVSSAVYYMAAQGFNYKFIHDVIPSLYCNHPVTFQFSWPLRTVVPPARQLLMWHTHHLRCSIIVQVLTEGTIELCSTVHVSEISKNRFLTCHSCLVWQSYQWPIGMKAAQALRVSIGHGSCSS